MHKITLECRIVSFRQHLLNNKKRNEYVAYIPNNESNNIMRIGEDLLNMYSNFTAAPCKSKVAELTY